MIHIDKTIAAIRKHYVHAIEEVVECLDETTVVLVKDALLDVCEMLRDDPALDYNFLADLAAVDHAPREPRFTVSYIPYSMQYNARLRLKVFLPEGAPELPTLIGVWPSAEWPEREAWDMMGIKFTDHPDLRRILMPADWEGHPHRKDYPLGYEEVQFSFNWRDIDSRKHYPED